MQDIPQTLQEILYYNPLVHFMEMLHANYFYSLTDDFVNYQYMLIWTVIPLFMGLWLYQKLEKRIVSL
jgi:capsular polysaccharide transport system permease protein